MQREPGSWSCRVTQTLTPVVLGAVVLGLVACQSNDASSEPTASPQPAPSSEDPRTADTGDVGSGPLLVRPPFCDTPSQTGDCIAVETDETSSFSAAEYYGEVIVRDGCVFIRIDGRAPDQVVVFPNGTSWTTPRRPSHLRTEMSSATATGSSGWATLTGPAKRR